MMAQIRAFAKSPVATVLLSVLVVAFVVFGIRGVATTGGASDQVLKAGARPPITSAAFKDRFNFYKSQLEQQNQQPISMQEAVAHDLDRQVLDELASSEAFADMLARLGVRPSDQLIVQKLRTIPSFFNPITGQFDKGAYDLFLQKNNLTAAQADGELRDEIGERQFVSGMAAGLRSPLVYAAVQAAYLKEARSFQWFTVSPKLLGPPVRPTDAQLNAFIHQNAAQMTLPEMRQLSVVRFSAAALAPTLAVTDAQIQKRFDFEKDTLSTPEKRAFVQISVKDPKTAAEIAARLKGGADPQDLARHYGDQATPYINQVQGAVPDKIVAAAVFAMKPGETSGPIQGDLGLSVVRLFSITPGHAASLAEARPKIEAEVKAADAQTKAYDLVQKYDDSHSGGADMTASAKAAGQTVTALPPIVAKGVTLQGQPANLPPKVLQAAFAAAQGSETDPIDAGQGEYYVVRVDKVLPPALPPLDAIRPKLTQYFILHDAAMRLQAKAQAVVAAIGKGQSLADAAKSVGAEVAEASAVPRNGVGQTFSTDLVGRVFQAKPGEVVVGEDTKLGFVVARLDKVIPASAEALVPLIQQQRDTVSKSLFEDLGQATRAAARVLVKPRLDYAKARQALGVDPSQAPAAPTGTTPAGAVQGGLAK